MLRSTLSPAPLPPAGEGLQRAPHKHPRLSAEKGNGQHCLCLSAAKELEPRHSNSPRPLAGEGLGERVKKTKRFFISKKREIMLSKKKFGMAGNALITAMLLLKSSLSFADDTEIFLSRGASGIKPNVFFLLDNSTSMKWCLDKDNHNPALQGACPNGTKNTRLQVLKETLNNLLPKMQGVNFGLMALHYPGITRLAIDDIDKVRAEAIRQVNTMTTGDWTPIAKRLRHAARYINGFQGNKHPEQKSFPGHNSWDALYKIVESPIKNSCQPTHLVLLTDGDPNADPVSRNVEKLNIKNLIGIPNPEKKDCAIRGSNDDETCIIELVEWMHQKDQSPLEGMQTVTTHSIGFALKALGEKGSNLKEFLKEVSYAGGGDTYTANSAAELTKAFDKIMQQVADVDNASFVNPSAAASPENVQVSDQLYYPLFRPAANDRWLGNVKRYRLDEETNSIVDADGNAAFDEKGNFSASARSFWSEEADGGNTGAGGAASKLPLPAQRRLYFSEDAVLKPFDEWEVPKVLKGAVSEDKWFELLHYISGEDDSSKPRQQLGDFLHSQPMPFDYADKSLVVLGSNEGFVHFFDRDTGVEEFAFMPEALLKNIELLHKNEHSTQEKPHPYGMDNTVTVWIEDENHNNKADNGEAVYAYASMRRGGRNLYALDISDHTNPKLAWQIIGGKDKGFEHLGQTWSQPIKTIINIKGKATDVLIFGGGYDPVEDDFNGASDGYARGVSMGNDIYIVDAKSGEKLWSAKDSFFNLNAMKYSIPARLRVIVNKDGLAEQFFASDTGGQIWRFVIDNENGTDDFVSLGAKNGLFASLGSNDTAGARRFYHEPDIALDGSGSGLMVNIGSGYHAHPLNTHIEDRFYSLRTAWEGNAKTATLMEDDLADVTEHMKADVANALIKERQGWYIKLRRKGEKVLSSAVTVYGELFFNTYVPTPSKISCQVTQGSNFGYHVFAQNGTPAEPDTLNPNTFKAMRDKELHVSGLAGTPSVVYSAIGGIRVTPEGKKLTKINGSLCNKLENPRGCKVFWMDLDPGESPTASASAPPKSTGT